MDNKKFCDPGMCDDCLYLCEGDFLCGKTGEVVMSGWEPTKYFGHCKKKLNKKRRRKA